MFSCFETILECFRQTDRQTDGPMDRTAIAISCSALPRMHTRDKIAVIPIKIVVDYEVTPIKTS